MVRFGIYGDVEPTGFSNGWGFWAQKKQPSGMTPRFGPSNWKPKVVLHTSKRAGCL